MTDKWQSGKTYPPGSLVVPASQPAVDATQAQNGDFSAGNTGWDYTGSCTFSSTGGYSNANCCIAPGVTAGGLALNKAKFLMSPGETISASCMIQQGASDVDHTRGYVQVLFFDASDVQIGQPVSGNIVNDGRGGAWHQSTLATPAAAPAGTAYARCGIYLYQNSADPIWGDNLVVYYARRKPAAGLIFKATQPAPGKSAQTEPVWPTSAGVTVTDNEVIWEGVIATRLVWEASPILKSGATEPAWPDSIGGAVHDGTIDWIAISRRVEDVNCPNSKVVAIMASKVFAADGDIVRFSATVNPLDWTSTQNAGYLPTGLQQANANDMAVLAPYRSNLTAFNASSFQNWQVDPDPAAMALLDQMDGIGSRHQHAAQAVGNDLYYLSQLGVRTVSIAAGTDNLKAGDVGMPVDVLVRDSIRISTANDTPVLATYYPSAGQYWLAVRALQPLTLSGDLPDGPIGEVVNYQYTVSGGVLPRSVSIASGELPAGLSMSASGLVTGTRTAVGDFAWTVRATDANRASVDLADMSRTRDVFIYVSHSAQNKVYALRKSTGALSASIPVGVTPSGVAISPDGMRVYVANASSDTVSVIDTGTNAVIATIAVGTNPVDICVSKDGSRGYTANQGSNTVSVVDLISNTLISTVSKGVAPFACNTNPINGDVYVVGGANSTVYLLDADGATKASVSVTNPSGVAASPDGQFFYVVGMDGLTAFDAETHANLGNINLRGGYGPQDVEITPDGKTAYVADYNYTDLKVVDVTNKAAMTLITSIAGVGKSTRIAMDSIGSKAYVTTAAGTVVIDVATNAIETTYPYGNFGVAVGVAP